MPLGFTVTFDSYLSDLSGTARVDGYVEVASTEGHGIKVVTEAERDLLVAQLVWEDVEPIDP